MGEQVFQDRYDAGRQLAKALHEYKNSKEAILLAIPRGALQIGEVLHKELHLPLDIIITKKIPHPLENEFAIGAVGPGGIHFLNHPPSIDVPLEYVEKKISDIAAEINKKYAMYRGECCPPELRGKAVIIVDDGLATGSTMRAAIQFVKREKPKEIVIAVPVAPPDSIERVWSEADKVICLYSPENFFAIGQFYRSFPQVEDSEAIEILKRCRR